MKPKEHYATGVAAHLQPLAGRRVLLLRAEGATDHLPEALRRQGRLPDTSGDRVFAEVRAWKDNF